jgi:hypothetical protein
VPCGRLSSSCLTGWDAKTLKLPYLFLPDSNSPRITVRMRLDTHGRMARGGHGLPKDSPGPAMLYSSTPWAGRRRWAAACGRLIPLLDTPPRTPMWTRRRPTWILIKTSGLHQTHLRPQAHDPRFLHTTTPSTLSLHTTRHE